MLVLVMPLPKTLQNLSTVSTFLCANRHAARYSKSTAVQANAQGNSILIASLDCTVCPDASVPANNNREATAPSPSS